MLLSSEYFRSPHFQLIIRFNNCYLQLLYGSSIVTTFIRMFDFYCSRCFNTKLLNETLHVDHCEVCQHMNPKVTTERPQLFPIPVKSPMYHVGIDSLE